MNIFDPTMTVPPDVAAAADKLTNYFADLGFTEWRLNGCASREQLEFTDSLLGRTQSENEALAQRLAVRMEELQQAVQARLAAEKQVGQLLAALEQIAASGKWYASALEFDLDQDGRELERLVFAAIAAVKGGAQ